jgi:hypothetical protein
MVSSTVNVRNMRYVVGRDRQLLINFVYLADNFRWEIFPRYSGSR